MTLVVEWTRGARVCGRWPVEAASPGPSKEVGAAWCEAEHLHAHALACALHLHLGDLVDTSIRRDLQSVETAKYIAVVQKDKNRAGFDLSSALSILRQTAIILGPSRP